MEYAWVLELAALLKYQFGHWLDEKTEISASMRFPFFLWIPVTLASLVLSKYTKHSPPLLAFAVLFSLPEMFPQIFHGLIS